MKHLVRGIAMQSHKVSTLYGGKVRKFNEKVEHDEIKDFCESSLAYLLDDGVVVKVSNYDRSEEEVEINFYDKFTWNDIKDHVIPLLIRVIRKYELGEFGSYLNKKNFNFCVKGDYGIRADIVVSSDEVKDIEQILSKQWNGELIMDKIIFYVKSEK